MRTRLLWTACLLAAATSLPITAAEKRDADEEAWIAARDAGATAGFKAYLKEFPKGRHAAAARVKLAILTDAGGVQPGGSNGATSTPAKAGASITSAITRPRLPFELSEDVWSAIEKSDLARATYPRKTIEIAYTDVSDSVFAKLHVQTTQVVNKRITPLADARGYQEVEQRQEASWTNSNGGRGAPQATSSRNYFLGGVLDLGTVTSDGVAIGRLSKIHEIQGSLYPLHIGAEVSLRYDYEYVQNHDYNSTIATQCRIIAKVAASTLSPQLPGDAWQLGCRTTTVMNGKTTEAASDKQYIVGDWGVTYHQLGILDLTKKTMVVPDGHYQYTFLSSVHNINGYRITARD
ncbi:MAG: hypothetical protein JSR63_11730 [Proteobacteria bacterium]|nr:hypothetical protein [Pseudomonadota bacterium]